LAAAAHISVRAVARVVRLREITGPGTDPVTGRRRRRLSRRDRTSATVRG